MGTYGISKKEIVESIAKALDELEGDFTRTELLQALIKVKEYPYVSDKDINDGNWQNYLNVDAIQGVSE